MSDWVENDSVVNGTDTPSYNSLFDVVAKILNEPQLGKLVLFFKGEWLANDIAISESDTGDNEAFKLIQKQRKEAFEGGVIALFLRFRKYSEDRFVASAKKAMYVEELGAESGRYDIFLRYLYTTYILNTNNGLSDVDIYQQIMRDIRMVAIHRDYANLQYLKES